jgi:hypothetical protein
MTYPKNQILLIPPPQEQFNLLFRTSSEYKRNSQIYLVTVDFSVVLCNRFPERVFVFSDNIEREGIGGQAIIRNCENSFGIRTKKRPKNSPGSFFTDRDYIHYRNLVNHDMQNLYELNKEHPIALSANGYGTGLAKLYLTAPKCFSYLVTKLNEFCDDNIFNPYYAPEATPDHGPTV